VWLVPLGSSAHETEVAVRVEGIFPAERARIVSERVRSAPQSGPSEDVVRKEKQMANAVPEGHHTVTPHLIVKGGAKAMDFYAKAFGAQEVARMAGPDGRLMHAEMRIGNSLVYLADEYPEYGGYHAPGAKGSPVTIHLYLEDVDAAWARALAAGAKVRQPLMDMFWGDRYGQVVDPFGHVWSMATHKEDLTPDEMMKRASTAMPPPPRKKKPAPKNKPAARPKARAKKSAAKKKRR
jgi:uncharacterized glyoxalase superfamily protein PhnB